MDQDYGFTHLHYLQITRVGYFSFKWTRTTSSKRTKSSRNIPRIKFGESDFRGIHLLPYSSSFFPTPSLSQQHLSECFKLKIFSRCISWNMIVSAKDEEHNDKVSNTAPSHSSSTTCPAEFTSQQSSNTSEIPRTPVICCCPVMFQPLLWQQQVSSSSSAIII